MIVGVVGDAHLPWAHPLYLEFCIDVFTKHKVDTIVNIGDVIDHHCLSFWDSNPNGYGPEGEAEEATIELERWYRHFPYSRVCIGNHDARHYRKARKSGIPDRFIRGYSDVWDTPEWTWEFDHVIDDVMYSHGTLSSGKTPAYNRAMKNRCSTVIGHCHHAGGIKYHSNRVSRIFGMDTGCGIDVGAYAFEYGTESPDRPILGCGVVVDGVVPYWYAMPIGAGEKYCRSKAKKGRRNVKRKRRWG